MKFGDTLRSRSIPEWGHYNIDYDYLKDLIKHQTTPGTNKAVSIPGQGESTERVFRETFLQTLQAQHDRINLFVRSKSGEIERRLDHISTTLQQLQTRRGAVQPGAHLPAKLVERYAKIDADVTRTGEEIRSLSRFQVAQRTGFTKILKKYRRWTKDKELSHEFKQDISSQPDSLFQLDLGYLLDQYIDVLGALRTIFDLDGTSSSEADSLHTQSAAAKLTRSLDRGDELDFDVAFSTVPLGSSGNKATYWIHPDHVVETQVLLLQHMRLFANSNTKPSSPTQSKPGTPIRRKSSSATTERCFGKEDDVGLVVLDHAEAFAIKQNTSTIGANEATRGNIILRAAGNARCVASGAAAIMLCTNSNCDHPQSTCSMKTARTDTRSLMKLLEGDSLQSVNGNDKPSKLQGNGRDAANVKEWLAEHKEVRPIAGVGSRRTRFIGLHNNSAGGIWATLDQDVYMKDSFGKDLENDDWPTTARAKSIAFPHAILEVRREGAQATALIQTLDKSYLVERVRGFSIEAHAVWICCKPSSMTSPFWIPLLEQDIRKLPEHVKRRSRKSKSTTVTTGSPTQHSPPQTSTSNTSYDGQSSPLASRNGDTSATSAQDFVDPPSLQAFRKKRRRPFSDYPAPMVTIQEPEAPRYWNEYDHPEDEETGGYYIYVDPDAPVKFPGQDFFEACVHHTKKLFSRRLSADDASLSAAEDAASSDDESSEESPLVGDRNNYGTLSNSIGQSRQREGYFSNLLRSVRNPYIDGEAMQDRRSLFTELQIRQHKTEMTKLRFYTTCLFAAVAIDFILYLMTITSRKKERGAVDIGVLFGTIVTLVLCMVALISMKTRQERLGWVHQGAVLSIATAVVAMNVLLISWFVLRV